VNIIQSFIRTGILLLLYPRDPVLGSEHSSYLHKGIRYSKFTVVVLGFEHLAVLYKRIRGGILVTTLSLAVFGSEWSKILHINIYNSIST
jgi:hypothetical protein